MTIGRTFSFETRHEVVFYVLHIGTFTPESTFDTVISKLDHLQKTSITAIEIMPVAQQR